MIRFNKNITKNIEEVIKDNLKQEIEKSIKTKTQIADALGISRATLSQYLSGKVMPSLPTFAKLCEVLDCSSDDILGL